MKRSFGASLRCISCRRAGLTIRASEENDSEVREGAAACPDCGREFPIRNGILDTLDPADEVIQSEIRGWIELAGPLPEGLVSTMTALPYYPHGPWPHAAPDFFQLFEHVDFAGKHVVDIGAGRTWSTRFVKTIGRAEEVVALDVLQTRFLGLETAEVFFREDGIHFERIAGDLHDVPLVDGWADVVVSCASVHHSSSLEKLFREAWRLLKPGGIFTFVSEPSKKASVEATRPENAETEHGINEHIYAFGEYMAALRGVGFRPSQLSPRSVCYRLLYPDPEFLSGLPPVLAGLVKTSRGRRLFSWLAGGRLTGPILYRFASLPLSVVARKPAT